MAIRYHNTVNIANVDVIKNCFIYLHVYIYITSLARGCWQGIKGMY